MRRITIPEAAQWVPLFTCIGIGDGLGTLFPKWTFSLGEPALLGHCTDKEATPPEKQETPFTWQ